MFIKKIIAPALALGLGAVLLTPGSSDGFSLIGFSLQQSQRDFRVFNNFSDASANNNQTADLNFPGAQGAVMAIWKGSIEWGSEKHGDGNGDPSQNGGLGSGGANFDPSYQNLANGTGSLNGNIHSELSGGSGGVLAFTEAPGGNGWRIRYYSSWLWKDGPGSNIGSGMDLQGVACHEYGHAIGLGHSTAGGATMSAFASGNGVADRSISTDDSNGVKAIYGAKSASKPLITDYLLVGNTLTVNGSNFNSGNNQVWFTQKSTGGTGQPVKVTGVASPSGTSLNVTLPANAGPGDILVRRNSTGHSGLSNAFPFDPAVSGLTCGITQYGTTFGGTNTATLQCVSNPVLGGALAVVGSDFNGNLAGQLAFSLTQVQQSFLGGTILIDFTNPIAMLPISTFGGFSVTQVPIPNVPGLEYLSVFAQAACFDPASPTGWSFTNGLEIVLCP